MSGTAGERLALAAKGDAPQRRSELQKRLGFSEGELSAALDEALGGGLVRQIDPQRYWAAESWQQLYQGIVTELSGYHQANPLRLGMPRPELQSRLKTKLSLLDTIIEGEDRLILESGFVRLGEHTIRFSAGQQAKVMKVMHALEAEPYSPPGIAELNRIAGEELVRALSDLRRIVQVNDDIAFAAETYDLLVAEIRRHISEAGEIDAKTLRDKFGSSRKYAIAMLEHLDSLGITQRVGDLRKRGRNL